jgi:flagellar protein FliO/FliZ
MASLAAAPLSDAEMMSAADASASTANKPIAIVASQDAAPASRPAAPEQVGTQATKEVDTADAIASTTAAANAAPVTPAGTIASNTKGVATTVAPVAITAAPATSAASNKQVTSAHVGTAAPLPQSPASAGSLGGAVAALVLVVGLILALAWLAKRLPGVAGATNPALRVVGSLSLGPRERVVVVAIGETQLLLGVGAGGTRTLHTLTEPLPVAAPATPAFAQLLAQHFGKKA